MMICSSGPMGIGTFRDSMKKGIIPRLELIKPQGLFNEYFFISENQKITETLQPSLTIARTLSPISKQFEDYVCISLDGESDGKNYRNPLNLVIVLDISGSMGSIFRSEK